MRIVIWVALAAFALPGRAGAEEGGGGPLVFTVHPSGVEGETLDEKLARRARAFRFICVGCGRGERGTAPESFRPLETLNAPGLAGALAVQP